MAGEYLPPKQAPLREQVESTLAKRGVARPEILSSELMSFQTWFNNGAVARMRAQGLESEAAEAEVLAVRVDTTLAEVRKELFG